MSHLPYIDSPEDLKDLSFKQLEELASEIRQKIIEVMSVNGGHLASNLGSVELTLALHKVFHSPEDKLIWDVSHQAYTHKLLTGRLSQFHTIRKYKGLSGFTHPEESSHDHFFSGHAGTAVSVGLGLAKSRDVNREDHFILPVIGDAALTCGLTLEAMNNIPNRLKKFIIILNDNQMSISKNVGAVVHILSRLLSNPTTHKLHEEFDFLLSKLPKGQFLARQASKIKKSLKNLVSKAPFFEQFGLSYIGPIDGHNIAKIVDSLEGVKDSNTPIILHLLTNKGHGMDIAVSNPTTYHGVKPFDVTTGKFLPNPSKKPTYPKIFGKHLLKMAEKDPSLLVVTPAMSSGSCLDELAKQYPNRLIDVGIAEGHCVTYSGALAKNEKNHVICSIYSTFLQRAMDNVFHDVCLQKAPLVFAIDRAGLAGGDGATHNGIYDIGFLNGMPNMVIAQPRDGHVLKELIESSFDWKRPTAIRYPNLPTDEGDKPVKKRLLGKAEVLCQGKEYLIVSLGHMSEVALEVRRLLENHGVEATVVDPVFIKPLDKELFRFLLLSHRNLITIEEHSVRTGLGSILNHFVLEEGLDVKIVNFGVPEKFIEHGSHSQVLYEAGLTSEQIYESLKSKFSLKNKKVAKTFC